MWVSAVLEGPHVLLSGRREDGICLRSLLRCVLEEVSQAAVCSSESASVIECFLSPCRLLHRCHDDSSRFIYLLAKPGCSYLEQEDLIPLLQVTLPNNHINDFIFQES